MNIEALERRLLLIEARLAGVEAEMGPVRRARLKRAAAEAVHEAAKAAQGPSTATHRFTDDEQ